MAKYADQLPANVNGTLFVDKNCIDGNTSRWIWHVQGGRAARTYVVHNLAEAS